MNRLMTKKHFRESYPFLYENGMYEHYSDPRTMHGKGYKTERGYLKYLERQEAEWMHKCSLPEMDRIEIEVSWSNNNSYRSYCPRAVMRAWDKHGAYYTANAYADGHGYDKLSTVMASCLNTVLSGMLYRRRKKIKQAKKQEKLPYGLLEKGGCQGGVGANCYYDIANFLGGTMQRIELKKSDYIVFTF